ncbi:MAG TPA: sigma-70 family RNA polymerase sigma factor [Actinotalea caeni]|uniref:RNA polymerase sigma factor n=1 Tax=Actinotalea caeni TaxID=1348467 RepID=UPI002B4AB269|nr:sigma-70 family RNA polymerase sigma factor [Actinotalea caeni]HLV53990.1 sigma-70 family RNA polymerase sigma factor [Actinotalea caeni]
MSEPFEHVVRSHGRTVLRVCRAIVGPHDADDAWSETFLAAMRAYPDLPADANVEAWLVRIAQRKAIDVHRARRRAPVPTDDLPERGGAAEAPAFAGWQRDLWEDLAQLPDKQRAAVVYHHVAGLPHAEVAALLGGTPAAARRASADGIAALRRIKEQTA